MAEEEMTDAPAETPEAPKKSKKKMIIKIAVVALLACLSLSVGLITTVGVGGLKQYLAGETKDDADIDGLEHERKDAVKEGEEHPTGTEVAILNFDEMVVNIIGYTASGRKTTRFLKIKLSLAYDPAEADHLEEKQLYMRDHFQDYLRQVNEREIQGSHGFASLKKELLKRAKTISGNDAPKEVLIGEFIIQ